MLWLLIGYMFLFIHRPFEVWPVLGDLHVERIYMVGALLALAVYGGKKWIPNGLHFAFLAFAAAVVLCWVVSPWADKGEETVENVEGPALDDTLWTGRPRDFDWGD